MTSNQRTSDNSFDKKLVVGYTSTTASDVKACRMTLAQSVILAFGLLLISCSGFAHLDQAHCGDNAQPLTYEFDSGARWELCWSINESKTLELSRVAYAAPNNPLILVLEDISLASALLHYDEDVNAVNLLHRTDLDSQPVLLSEADCNGTLINENVCQRETDLGQLNRHATEPVLRRRALSLMSVLDIGAQTLAVEFTLTEDGRIDPSIAFSGRVNRLVDDHTLGTVIRDDGTLAASASQLYLWRIDFNLDDTPSNDIVTEYQFNGDTQDRKLMQASRLAVETFRNVQPDTFRGWQISDQDRSSVDGGFTRIGYYLDPQPSGFAYRHPDYNWAQFDVFVTVNRECERLALNPGLSTNCGEDLDDYINGELLDEADPVLWYSLTRRFVATSSDWPAIRSREARFSLIPFDWSASTPFSDAVTGEP